MSLSLHPDTPQSRSLQGAPAGDAAPRTEAGNGVRTRLFTK